MYMMKYDAETRMSKLFVSLCGLIWKDHAFVWEQWLTPINPDLWEAEVGGSPEVGSLRPD